ncbi:hypothetical protein IW140_004176 [Coemansia sp. RSA 1813]|nr:hypothetical protein EV178_002280 [Coemansia sp. RSA 1646]KAJ1766952.1 hypothetical protein LPJ74_005622 [Coemansia sp. RSA 1843]KAJ2090039.1 hypothetical protein IW138_003009 [Coemansia sp. RSA 986]KAJ2217001.1 hypothetical protein EV179_000767 [Coemansia sp. RSA 487]KAJ2568088.1 hypothetical protein IW140_004176 [Coemansia sp. RSA 1813]
MKHLWAVPTAAIKTLRPRTLPTTVTPCVPACVRLLWQATSPVARTEDSTHSTPDLFSKALKDMFSETQSELAIQTPDVGDKCFGKRANRVESRLLLRQALSQKLELEIAEHAASLELATAADNTVQTEEYKRPIRRHILVREFTTILRRLDTGSFTSADMAGMAGSSDMTGLMEVRGQAAVVVSAAWAHYCKLRERSNASTLIRQIPMSAICLLITELAFMSGSKEYNRRFERIIHIFSDFLKYGRPIRNPVQFGMYLRALNKLGQHQLAVKEADAYFSQESSIATTPNLAMGIKRQVIIAYFKGNRPDKALAEFQSIRTDQIYRNSITPHVYSTFLGGALRAKHIPNTKLYGYVEEMLNVACKQEYPDTSRTGILNELMHAAHKASNPDFFFYILERSLARNIKLNYTTFGTLLHFSSVSYATDARQLYQLYKKITTSAPNWAMMTNHIFAIFVNWFVRMGRIDYALCTLNDLRQHPTAQITARHFLVLFSHYAEFGMARHALDLYHVIVDVDKLQVPWKICMDIIRSIWHCDELTIAQDDTAFGLQAQGGDQPASVHSKHDNLAISALKCGRVHDIEGMFDAFFKLHSCYPKSTFALAILFNEAHRMVARDACRSGMSLQNTFSPQTAQAIDDSWRYQLAKRLRKALNSLIRDSTRLAIPQELYNRAISVFAILHDYQSAQMLYNHMITVESMEPTTDTFNVLLRAFVHGSDTHMATDVLLHARRNNVPINNLTANALIHGYLVTSQFQQAIDVYAYIAGRPLPLHEDLGFTNFVTNAPLDTYTYVLLVSKLVDSGNIREAVIIFDDSFTVLHQVPSRLLSMLVAKLEENMQFDLAQLCLRRYSKRVKNSDPESMDVQDTAESANAPERLPISYFGYLLDQTDR